jgi:hypothetical protein
MADPVYNPTDDEKKVIGDVNSKFEKWKSDRRPHEVQWFINASFVRGQQYVEWSVIEGKLKTSPAPSHRVRLAVNRILPKFRARLAKFLKSRPVPIVVPASTDREDKLNARATQKVLDYLWRKQRLETKYRDALLWATTTGKGFWWFYWDEGQMARMKMDSPVPGLPAQTVDAPLGDVCVEVGSPFEVLVADPSASHLSEQPEIMRIKLRDLSEIKKRYPKESKFIKGDTTSNEVFHYERQIASLTSRGMTATSSGGQHAYRGDEKDNPNAQYVTVKELFQKPCGDYPNGRYIVVAGDVLLKEEDALPYGFTGDNPYPCVEFTDVSCPGQFWPTTIVEQLIGLQKEYNLIRSKVAEQLRLMAFPKLMAAKQHQIPEGSWTSEPGEFIEFIALPGIPPPTPFHPPNIAGDAWRTIDLIKSEFEDITHIFPAAEGNVGEATSGFQTNLLQEAADSVHAPDIRGHELSIEESAFKMRALMKQGYTVPRLIAITGRNYEPDVFEFSAESIDEHADIVVQAGSALPMLKGAKIQSVMELWNSGLLGDQNDPENKRKTLGLLEMGEFEGAMETSRRDEDLAKLENTQVMHDQPVEPPEFFENHDIHYAVHTDELKSAEAMNWPPQRRLALISHILLHFKFINPQAAAGLAQEYGLNGLIPPPAPPPGAPPGPPPGPPGPPPPHGGGPPPGAPPPQAAPPPQTPPPPQGAGGPAPLLQ